MDPNSSDKASTLFREIESKSIDRRPIYRKKPTFESKLKHLLFTSKRSEKIPGYKASLRSRVKKNLLDKEELNVNDIGANWILKKIKERGIIDGKQSVEIAEEVFNLLVEGGEDCELGKKLLSVNLDVNFVKFLLRNRFKIVWCMRLMRAVVEERRKEIVDEMMGLGPDHVALLEQLSSARLSVNKRTEG